MKACGSIRTGLTPRIQPSSASTRSRTAGSSVAGAANRSLNESLASWQAKCRAMASTCTESFTRPPASAGNFTSENAHVVERYTPLDKDHLRYDVTIEDPTVFTRPWTISLPLYRRIDAGAELVEFRCVEFTERLLYGELEKKPAGAK